MTQYTLAVVLLRQAISLAVNQIYTLFLTHEIVQKPTLKKSEQSLLASQTVVH